MSCMVSVKYITERENFIKRAVERITTDRRNGRWMLKKVKVKCTLVQVLRLCTGRTAHRGSRGIALLILDHGTRRG